MCNDEVDFLLKCSIPQTTESNTTTRLVTVCWDNCSIITKQADWKSFATPTWTQTYLNEVAII